MLFFNHLITCEYFILKIFLLPLLHLIKIKWKVKEA